jgi:hypothetical protein
MFKSIELKFKKKSKRSKSVYYTILVDGKHFELLRISDHPNDNNYLFNYFSSNPNKVNLESVIVWLTPRVRDLYIKRNVIPVYLPKKKIVDKVPRMRNFNL